MCHNTAVCHVCHAAEVRTGGRSEFRCSSATSFREKKQQSDWAVALQNRAGMFPWLAIDYTRSMKVNTAVELLVQESFQLCSAMQSSVSLLLLLSKTGCRGTARFHREHIRSYPASLIPTFWDWKSWLSEEQSSELTKNQVKATSPFYPFLLLQSSLL